MIHRKSALVVVMSNIHSDPRVMRQIDWLTTTGWEVDTLGLGEQPSSAVRTHFRLHDQARWVRTRVGTVITYLFLPKRIRFARLIEDRISSTALERVSGGEYSLIVFNDMDFIPLVRNDKVFTAKALAAHIHLDLHEYRDKKLEINSLWRALTSDYYQWIRRHAGDSKFTTRSTVASGIAALYAADFGIPKPVIVRSGPPFIDQTPQPVDPDRIRLVYHGMASWSRGLREIVDAMRLVDARFEMTFMLTGSTNVIEELKQYAGDLADSVRFVPPVPMTDLSSVVNQYDLEIMFFRPTSRNLHFSLPNKLFEAVQGRLGLVIGESPMMQEIVDGYQNGVVVTGWTGADLAATLNALTTDEIAGYKNASHDAARELSSEAEQSVFLDTVDSER